MGHGTTFIRLPANELAALAAGVEHLLKSEVNRGVVALLRSKAEAEFQGWDRECWLLPGTLELLSFQYGRGHPALGFLRSDATRAEWKAHLDRLPEALRPVAHCLDVTLLTPEERGALRAAFDEAEADGWSRIHSFHFPLSRDELPFLFGSPESPGIDVLLQAGDGERAWRALDEFPDTRPEGAEPPSVLEDRNAPSRATARRQAAVRDAAEAAASAVTKGFTFAISLVYFSLCAIVPLLAYPVLLPDLLRSGDWAATLKIIGLLAAIGLLPLVLVWRRLGRRWRIAIFGVHALGLIAGVVRYAFT